MNTDAETLPGVDGALVRYVDDVPTQLEGATRVGPFSVARPGAVLRVVPGLARFLARDGSVVEITTEAHADASHLQALVQGPLAAALIHQRGELPLHGAVLHPPGARRAVAIVGPQGAGKSTLAWQLRSEGWQLVSDDLSRLTRQGEEILSWPGRPGIKLCRDACQRFVVAVEGLPEVGGERDKFLTGAAPITEPLPLGMIIQIDRAAPAGMERLAGARALAVVSSNTFRSSYITPLGQAAAHLRMVSALVSRVAIFRLCGPGSPADYARQVNALLTNERVQDATEAPSDRSLPRSLAR